MGLLDEIDAAAVEIMRWTQAIREEAAEIRHEQATAIETPELMREGDDDGRS